jgi:hypothetical protein
LAGDPVTDAIKIDIEVDKDMVQLNGFVDTEAERSGLERSRVPRKRCFGYEQPAAAAATARPANM